jgi:hypothetical protein
MMFLHELDFRRDWLNTLYKALSGVIGDIERKLEENDHYDGVDALEDSEWILGIAFIAGQTYLTGTWADLNVILVEKGVKESLRSSLLELDVHRIGHGVTRVQLVDAIANYHKHHDEWDRWQIDHKNKTTIEVLNRCGIDERTEFPCYTAATLLWPESRIGALSYLLSTLEDWRARVFRQYLSSSEGAGS